MKDKAKSQKRIPKISEKQQSRIDEYNRKKEQKRVLLIRSGRWNCIFTNTPLSLKHNYMPPFHHIDGRDGDSMTDLNNIWPTLSTPHIQYHSFTYNQLCKLDWYSGFLNRLKIINPIWHKKEKKKAEKGNL